MKGFIQIAFLPFLLAGLIGVGVIGLGGAIFQKTSGGLAKLGLIALGIYAGFVILQKQTKKSNWNSKEIMILLVIVGVLIWVIAGSDLPFSGVFKSIVSP